MKKTTLTLALLFAVSALIYAGPEAISGKEMKQVAPVPPPCPTWGGFYVGGFGGYKFASVNQTLDLGSTWDTLSTTERDVVEPEGSRDLDTSGAELGGLVGYNFQWNRWVFGLEADGGYLWLRDSTERNFDTNGSNPVYELDSSFKTRYLFTFAPRVGYTFCKWMPYVTGGLAVGDIDYSQEIINQTLSPHFFEGGSSSETKAGWMVGGGLEYALTDHWRLRGQYQYIDLGSTSFDSSTDLNGLTYTGHHEVEVHEHNASFAVMFRF
jgi:outer membrane immunogenic protein